MNLGTGGRMTSARVSGPRKWGSFSRVAQAREKQVYAAVREALVSIRRFIVRSVIQPPPKYTDHHRAAAHFVQNSGHNAAMRHAGIASVLGINNKLRKNLIFAVIVKAQA
jgi:hypothetical protein